MEILTVNFAAKARRVIGTDGKTYLVAPVTLIVPGVLNGSQGPLYYPADECAKSPERWNGVPLTLDHPLVNGSPVSAFEDGIYDKIGLGILDQVTFNGSKLRGLARFDESRVKERSPTLHSALIQGQPVEISTGLFTTNHPPEGAYNGTPYKATARDYRPDHLAILVDKTGACSVKAGCGLLVTHEESDTPPNQTQNTSKGDTNMARAEDIGWLTTNCDCWKDTTSKADLEKLSDSQIAKLKVNAEKAKNAQEVEDAAKKGFTDPGGNSHVYNTEKKAWETKPKETPKPAETQANNTQPSLTPEQVEDLAFAREEKAKRKTALIDRITSNVTDQAQKTAKVQYLQGKSLSDLTQIAELLPASSQTPNTPQDDLPRWVGAAVQVGNGTTQTDNAQVLMPPTNNVEMDPIRKRLMGV